VYVWFDALPNYISAIGFPDDGFERWWPAQLHVIGKDITRFHCVIWPAMLMSAGLELPGTVWAHGFVKIGGGKLSKSEASLLDLDLLIDRHGVDAFRYFLLRDIPWDRDRDFPTVEAFLQQFDDRYTAELANDLGNLLNRTVSMVGKFRDGQVPGPGAVTPLDEAIDAAVLRYGESMQRHALSDGLDAALSVVREANAFIDATRPWSLAKEADQADELDAVLRALIRALTATAVMLSPFMPGKAAEMLGRLGAGDVPPLDAIDVTIPERLPERVEGVLFPRPEPATA
jgi:methionyl-tRNA synthetase